MAWFSPGLGGLLPASACAPGWLAYGMSKPHRAYLAGVPEMRGNLPKSQHESKYEDEVATYSLSPHRGNPSTVDAWKTTTSG